MPSVSAEPSTHTTTATEWILATVGLAGAVIALSLRRTGDFDLPWHLSMGRLCVTTQALPRIDPLAFTHHRVQHIEFLSDGALYLIDRCAGVLGLQVSAALLTAVTGWLMYRRSKGAGPVLWVLVALGLAAMNAWLLVRPSMLSFVMLAVLLLIIEQHRHYPERCGARIGLLIAIPMQLVWVNAHGYASLGALLMVGYCLYRVICRMMAGRTGSLLPAGDGEHLPFVLASTLGVIVVSGANMAGFRYLWGPALATSDFGQITEWATTTPSFLVHQEPLVGVFLLVLLVSIFAGREPTGQRLPCAWDLGVVLLALGLGWSAVRLIPVAAVLTAPIAARRLAWLVCGSWLMRVCCPMALVALGPWMLLTCPTSVGVGFEPSHMPEGAVQYIERAEPKGNMWNFLPFGGYLGWRLYPRHAVFIDGRTTWVHGPELTNRALQSETDAVIFESLVRQFDMQWAVSRATEGENFGVPLATSRDWSMVYWDDVAAVYVRTLGKNQPLAESGYRLLRHLTPLGQVLEASVAGVRASDLHHDGELAAQQAPDSARAVFIQACGALAVRDRGGVDRAIDRLAHLAPGHVALVVLRQAADQVR